MKNSFSGDQTPILVTLKTTMDKVSLHRRSCGFPEYKPPGDGCSDCITGVNLSGKVVPFLELMLGEENDERGLDGKNGNQSIRRGIGKRLEEKNNIKYPKVIQTLPFFDSVVDYDKLKTQFLQKPQH